MKKSNNYFKKIIATSQNLYEDIQKMKWQCKHLSHRMETENEQNSYSENYKILKNNFKTNFATIDNLVKQLEVEKETILPTVWCKPNKWNYDCSDELDFFE